MIEHHQHHHGPAEDIDGVDASGRAVAGAMRGVAWSGDAAGSIDMTGLLSADRAGSVNNRRVDASIGLPLAPTVWVRRALLRRTKILCGRDDEGPPS